MDMRSDQPECFIGLEIEYEGSGFHGWQVQPGLRTIQRELHRVLETVLRCEIGHLHSAGRTDAGVHARRQMVVATLQRKEPDLFALMHSVSSIMRPELGIVRAGFMPSDFHPRSAPSRKRYVYSILNRPAPAVLDRGRVWHLAATLNVEVMQSAAAALVGQHDFQSFRGAGCGASSSVRTIYESRIINEPPYVKYVVVGNGFLKQMVRNIAGTLVALGRGKLEADSMQRILDQRDRRAAGVTAPPYGLCLDRIEYDDPEIEARLNAYYSKE